MPSLKPRSGFGEVLDSELLYLALFEALEGPSDSSFRLRWASLQYRRWTESPLDSMNFREQSKH